MFVTQTLDGLVIQTCLFLCLYAIVHIEFQNLLYLSPYTKLGFLCCSRRSLTLPKLLSPPATMAVGYSLSLALYVHICVCVKWHTWIYETLIDWCVCIEQKEQEDFQGEEGRQEEGVSIIFLFLIRFRFRFSWYIFICMCVYLQG